MAKDSKIYPEYPYFLTLTVAGHTDFFVRPEYMQRLMESIRFCQVHKGLVVYAYCLMTSHLHLIAGGAGDVALNEVIRSLKSFSAKALLQEMQNHPGESRREWLESRFQFLANIRAKDANMQFWERDNYPEAVFTDEFFRQKEKYIHENPVKAGFVLRPEDWYCSSACPEGPLEVVRMV